MQQQEQEGEEEEEMELEAGKNSTKRMGYDEMEYQHGKDEFDGFGVYENNFTTNPTSNNSSKY